MSASGRNRFDIPLSRRGVRVHGIDLSPDMVAQLQAKPGTGDIGVTIGDFATTRVDGTFGRRPPRPRRVLRDRGRGPRPALQRLPPGETVRPFTLTPAHLGFEEFDVATQIAFSHHYWVVDGRLEIFSAPFRYVWPSELDLMARLAGMTLRERWSDWTRAPFTSDSGQHVSVWERTPHRLAGLAVRG